MLLTHTRTQQWLILFFSIFFYAHHFQNKQNKAYLNLCLLFCVYAYSYAYIQNEWEKSDWNGKKKEIFLNLQLEIQVKKLKVMFVLILYVKNAWTVKIEIFWEISHLSFNNQYNRFLLIINDKRITFVGKTQMQNKHICTSGVFLMANDFF